jgi:predicted TPR repeat methyltransferase
MNPPIDSHVDGSEEFFSALRKSQINFDLAYTWGNILRYSIVGEQVVQLLTRSSSRIRILDIGCSQATLYGFLTANFSIDPSSIDYTGIEVDEESMHAIRRNYGDEVTIKTFDLASSDKFSDLLNGKFDLVVITQVVEHIGIKQTQSVLAQISEILSDDGLLILSSPNPKKHKGERFISEESHHHHVYEFAESEMKALLQSSGFEIVSKFGAFTRFNQIKPLFPNLEHSEKPHQDLGRHLHPIGASFATALVGTIFSNYAKNYLFIAKKS